MRIVIKFFCCVLLSFPAYNLVKAQTVRDISGNNYSVVKIGNQQWLKKNLMTKQLNDGTPIVCIKDKAEWVAAKSPAYCWYDNNITPYSSGLLYNYYAVNTGKLCPVGWHVSTEKEWSELIDFLGGMEKAGNKLKIGGDIYWPEPNEGATNEVYFDARPGGFRSSEGVYSNGNSFAGWWSFEKSDADEVYCWTLYDYDSYISLETVFKNSGYSVRCVKD